MQVPRRFSHPLARWIFSIGAIAVTVAQLGLVLAPLGEGREGRGTAAHVEVGGTATHYAHNDATCAACQARSLNGIATRSAAALAAGPSRSTADASLAERPIAVESLPHNNPRAPPSGT